jgi:hypothetical protein
MSPLHFKANLRTIIVCVFFSSAFAAAAEGALWDVGTSAFTLSGNTYSFPTSTGFFPADLSGSNFAAFPLSSSQLVSGNVPSASWSFTGASLLNPLVDFFEMVGDSVRSFSSPIVILSGMAGCTVTGNDLTCPPGAYSGIVQVTGDLNGLSVTSTATGFGEGITFGVASSSPLPTE